MKSLPQSRYEVNGLASLDYEDREHQRLAELAAHVTTLSPAERRQRMRDSFRREAEMEARHMALNRDIDEARQFQASFCKEEEE